MKIPALLKLLFAPFFASFAHAVDDEGGGDAAAADKEAADALARGDVLADGKDDPKIDAAIVDPLADPEADAAKAKADEEAAAAKDGKDDDKEEKDPKKDTRIPLARHKEMMEKGRVEREALQAQLAQYQQGQQVARVNEAIEVTETKLVELEVAYNKLLADGNIEKATEKMTEIRRMERTIGEQKTSMQVQAAEARAVERVRFDTTVERLEAAYPALNPDHEDFSKETVAEVLELQAAFKGQGATPSDAMQRAVKYVLGATTTKEKVATEVTPNVKAADVAAERKAAALATSIAAAKATPASTAKIGQNSDEKGGALTAEKAMKLSQEAFAKLNEADLARMRGDDIE